MLALLLWIQDTAQAFADSTAAGNGFNPLDPRSPEGISAIVLALASIFGGIKAWRKRRRP